MKEVVIELKAARQNMLAVSTDHSYTAFKLGSTSRHAEDLV